MVDFRRMIHILFWICTLCFFFRSKQFRLKIWINRSLPICKSLFLSSPLGRFAVKQISIACVLAWFCKCLCSLLHLNLRCLIGSRACCNIRCTIIAAGVLIFSINASVCCFFFLNKPNILVHSFFILVSIILLHSRPDYVSTSGFLCQIPQPL